MWTVAYAPLLVAALDIHVAAADGSEGNEGAVLAAESGAQGLATPELHPIQFLTHFPKETQCAECMKVKARNINHRRHNKGRWDPAPEDYMAAHRFGDLSAADIFVVADEASASRDGSVFGLVIQDKATVWIDCFPKATTNATDCIASPQQFVGPKEEVRRLCSDGAQ